MITRAKLEPLLFACAVAVSRFAFRSRVPYDLDSVNFALAIGRFDPRVYQPHPPGYFLYIGLGRVANWMVHDPNLALVLLSIAASCATVVLIYQLAGEWFGPLAARFACLLFLLSPLCWFHGTVALTYSVEAFFSALVGLFCWRVECDRIGFLLPASLMLGVSAGVRPSSLLLLGPLYLYSLRNVPRVKSLLGISALVGTILAWFLPMIWASGGFGAYFGALFSLWRLVPSKDTVFNSSPATSIARACFILLIYLLFFGAAGLLPLAARRGVEASDAQKGSRKKRFTLAWILPALCFFTFIFLKFVNSGYLMLLAAPACMWLGYWAALWYSGAGWPKSVKLAAIGVAAAADVLIFLAFPGYCSYGSVRHFEAELADVQRSVPEVGNSGELVIVGFDNHFLGYRHIGYELPSYLTLQYPEVKLIEGTRIFSMHGGETRLLEGLPSTPYSRFLLCPSPGGDAGYREFFDKVEALLPRQDLTTQMIGGHAFVTAPIGDLKLLFPNAAPGPLEGVYAPMHSVQEAVNIRSHPVSGTTP